jgi:hypothetical protein
MYGIINFLEYTIYFIHLLLFAFNYLMFMQLKKGGFYSGSRWNNAMMLSRSNPNQPLKTKLVETSKEENKETSFENLDSFFYNGNPNDANPNDANLNDANPNTYYLPTVGVTNLKLCEPNEVIADQATIFFRILDAFKIPYALFAGSSIGLLRNGKTLPFVDDYDIIIFNKHVPMLSNAAPILKKHGFNMVQSVYPQTKQKTNGGCTVYSSAIQRFYNNDVNANDGEECECSIKKSHFQCDVFFSYFDGGGFLRNNASWGLYHTKNIHVKDVLPFQRRAFDGMSLPFFNNVASEVYKCYGDVERCTVESHNFNVRATYRSWKTAHADFDRIKRCAKDNTMKAIFQSQHDGKNENNWEDGEGEGEDHSRKRKKINALNILDNAFSNNSLDVLRDIHENKTKTIYSFSMEFIIRHAACIKYYFPTVQIEYFSYSRDNQVVVFLNYVDVLHVYNPAIRDFYNDPHIIYLKKPRIDIITVVTFGAFSSNDSKDFSILTECTKYSENICVGLSCDVDDVDALEPFESRMNCVKRRCKFVKRVWKWKDDDSAETCGANIVVTGEEDDKDLITRSSCCCVIRAAKRNDDQTTMNNVNLKKTKNVHFSFRSV